VLGWLLAACSPEPRPLEWRDCGEGFECASLRVPRSHARPDDTGLDLSLIRRLATGDPAKRIGVLVVNPGGPGVPGVAHLRARHARLGPRLRERFDIVSFDPRGAGESEPLDCQGDLAPLLATDPDPDDEQEWVDLLRVSRDLARRCDRRHGSLLQHLDSASVARDLERIRAALGEARLSYLGFSYGSLLGAVYAALWPERVRAFVLDGIVLPGLTLFDFTLEQSLASERAFDRLLAGCSAPDCALARLGDPSLLLAALERELEREPLPSSGRNLRPAGPRELSMALFTALYSPALGSSALDALAGAIEARDGSQLVALADAYLDRQPDGRYPNSFAAGLGVTCLDLPAPRDADAWRARATRLRAAAPRFGVPNWTWSLPCAFWAAEPARLPLGPALGAPPMLLLASSGDPVVPYAWAERLRARLASAVLLRVESRAHRTYGRGNACVDGAVERYLLDLELPDEGASCPPSS
jgi:pimeloyl-ACP methyl ester carboxylesterase